MIRSLDDDNRYWKEYYHELVVDDKLLQSDLEQFMRSLQYTGDQGWRSVQDLFLFEIRTKYLTFSKDTLTQAYDTLYSKSLHESCMYQSCVSDVKIFITDRIRRMREGNVFSLSTPGGGGGVTPARSKGGGYPSQV